MVRVWVGRMYLVPIDRVDKRGRRLQQTSSEDMRKYYDLHDDAAENAVSNDDVMKGNPPPEARQQGRRLKKGKSAARSEGAGRREGAGVAADVRETETVSEGNRAREGQWEGGHYSESDAAVTDSDDSGSDTSTDVEEIMALREPEVGGACYMSLWVWLHAVVVYMYRWFTDGGMMRCPQPISWRLVPNWLYAEWTGTVSTPLTYLVSR